MDRESVFTHAMASVGVFAVGVELYRYADLAWLNLWVLVAFWIGYGIGGSRNGS